MVNIDHTVTWMEVDLDAVAHNVQQLRRWLGESVELIAVVKANAYGHGAVPVARAALEAGASRLAVGRTLEGVQLRRAGIEAPILLMSYAMPAEADTIVRWRLTPTVNSVEEATALSQAAQAFGKRLPVHMKADTGMGRFGLLPAEVLPFAQWLEQMPWLELEGFCSHFSDADASDKTYTQQQYALFGELVARLGDAGIHPRLCHIGNSAAALDLPGTALNAVRCGIALYGLRPSQSVSHTVPLLPVMSLRSRVARVRTLPAGSSVSYGRTYVTSRSTPLALVAAGYGDGYPRVLSNRGAVLIHEQRAPIVGRVCMDQCVVDISTIAGVQRDDEVVLFGRQGEAEITADEVAQWAGTLNYEVLTIVSPRVTRVYLRGHQVVAMHPLLGPGEW